MRPSSRRCSTWRLTAGPCGPPPPATRTACSISSTGTRANRSTRSSRRRCRPLPQTPGEEAWPTQPIPHTAAGRPMAALAAQFPTENLYPEFGAYRKLPFYTPPTIEGALHAPREGVHYGVNSFHPGTGLLYVAGRDFPIMMTAIPVGDTLQPGQFSTAGRRMSAAPALGNVSAYDPGDGRTGMADRDRGWSVGGYVRHGRQPGVHRRASRHAPCARRRERRAALAVPHRRERRRRTDHVSGERGAVCDRRLPGT